MSHDRNKQLFSSQKNSMVLALCACCMLISSLSLLAQQEGEISLIEMELQRRSGQSSEAKAWVEKGDKAYGEKDFAAAYAAYKKAFGLLPNGEFTKEYKAAVAERFAIAASQNAQSLVRQGKTNEARQQLEKVLSPEIAMGNVHAAKALAKLDDPIRTSPTLSAEHVEDVRAAALGLRRGQSFYNEGRFEEGLLEYEKVIQIDPYNKAARRGQEQIFQAMQEYGNAAVDETRAAMLAEVAEMWEKPVPEREDLQVDSSAFGDAMVGQKIRGKQLERTIVPMVDFDEVTIKEAMNQIRAWSREYDTSSLVPSERGRNFVLRLGDEDSKERERIENKRFSLKLTNVPLSVVLDNVTKTTETYWRAEAHAVVIRPVNALVDTLETRNFRVPPAFMEQTAGTADAEDPFSTKTGVAKQVGAQEYLRQMGILFPEGAFATYTKATGILTVRNTALMLDTVSDIVEKQSFAESVQVVIKTTILDVSESELKEMGYDQLVEQIHIKNGLFIGGGTTSNGGVIGANTEMPGGIVQFDGTPVTSGNRSGETMFSADAIDERIAGLDLLKRSQGYIPARGSSPLNLQGKINNARFQTLLRALSQNKGTSELHTPSLVVRSGQEARLFYGDQMFFADEYEAPEVPNSTVSLGNTVIPFVSSTPSSFTMKELGTILQVTPTVSDDRQTIDLALNPEIKTFQGYVNYGTPLHQIVIDPITGIPAPLVTAENAILMPVISTVRINTSLTVADGARFLVAKNITQKIEKVEDQVPILGDLPVLGRFFKTEGIRETKRIVLFFIEAELVDPTGKPWRMRHLR